MAVAMTWAQEWRMRSNSVIRARSSRVLRSGLGCCVFSSGIRWFIGVDNRFAPNSIASGSIGEPLAKGHRDFARDPPQRCPAAAEAGVERRDGMFRAEHFLDKSAPFEKP